MPLKKSVTIFSAKRLNIRIGCEPGISPSKIQRIRGGI
jgi:hypothetical protein